MNEAWRFEYEVVSALPQLAWVARVDWPVVLVRCGVDVRRENDGFFEGSWSGRPDLPAIAGASTVFGSGIVRSDGQLIAVGPAHMLEPLYLARSGTTLLVSNSLVGVLVAGGRSLRNDTMYPPVFGLVNRGLVGAAFSVPTDGQPVAVRYFENVAIERDGSTEIRPKRREAPFASFADYRDRLTDHVRSAFENAIGYEPTATISSGYDSTAAAAVGARAGCRRAVTFASGWPWRGSTGTEDSGEAAARALGMSPERFERLAYLALDDAPEAEFLATGMTGEDVPFRSMDPAIARTVLLTGYWGGALWRSRDRAEFKRLDLSGASLGEFRLRTGFVHLPLPFIGGLEQPALRRLRSSAEMRPYSVGGAYDEPLPRRLAEEAGVRRGTFATQKRASSQLLHVKGRMAMSASARRSFEAFAGPAALESLPRRRPITRVDRLALRTAAALRVPRVTAGIAERRRTAVHLEPVLGSLLLRWAVETIAPRYESVRGLSGERP